MWTFYGLNLQNGPTAWTAHFTHSGGVTFPIISVDCFSGVSTSAALDGHNAAPVDPGGTGVNAISLTGYATTAGSLIWAAAFNMQSNGAATAGTTPIAFSAGLTLSGNEGLTEYALSGPGGTNAVTFGYANAGDTYWIVGSMALKAAAGGAAVPSAFGAPIFRLQHPPWR